MGWALYNVTGSESGESEPRSLHKKSKFIPNKNNSHCSISIPRAMAPPKKPKQNTNSNKFPKSKKKNKNKSKIASSFPVDSKAIDSEWWDVFWKKNSSSHGTFQFLLHFRSILQVLFDSNPAVKFKLVLWIPMLIICSYPFLDLKDTFLGTSFSKLGNSNFDVGGFLIFSL